MLCSRQQCSSSTHKANNCNSWCTECAVFTRKIFAASTALAASSASMYTPRCFSFQYVSKYAWYFPLFCLEMLLNLQHNGSSGLLLITPVGEMRFALNALHQSCLWHWVWPEVRSQLLMAVKSCLIYCSRTCPNNHFNQKHGSPIASCILLILHALACEVFINRWCRCPDLQSVVDIYVKVAWILPLHHCITMRMRYGYEYAWVTWQSDIASLLQSHEKQHEWPQHRFMLWGRQQLLQALLVRLAVMTFGMFACSVFIPGNYVLHQQLWQPLLHPSMTQDICFAHVLINVLGTFYSFALKHLWTCSTMT